MPTRAVGMGASTMVGFHPELPSGAPELVVHATTGKATATSPVSGAVVAVVDVAPPLVVGELVVAEPMSELPQLESTPPRASRHKAAPRACGRSVAHPAEDRSGRLVVLSMVIAPDVKPTGLPTGGIGRHRTADPHSMGTGHATWASLSGLRTKRMATTRRSWISKAATTSTSPPTTMTAPASPLTEAVRTSMSPV